MNEYKDRAEDIIKENVSRFLNRIHSVSEISSHKKFRTKAPGFGLLFPGNEEFYQYAYYEGILEWFIRDELVNATLMELFHLFDVECLFPDTEGKVYVNASNERIEDIYPFQFIVKKERIGYRYTSVTEEDEELEQLIADYDIDKIVVINWSLKQDKRNYNSDERVSIISFQQFSSTYFPSDISALMLKDFRNAVKQANSDIGFQTIPRLSLRYLSEFKKELYDKITKKDFTKLRYKVLNPDSNLSQNYEKIVLDDTDYDVIEEYFKTNGLHKVLFGTHGFAKCFITAEYLYYIFKEGNSFDYTSVVSGYLKSVEQLVYEIVKINLLKCTRNDNFWIKGNYPKKKKDVDIMSRLNPITKMPQTLFIPENERYFDITLAPMIWFLFDNNRYRVSEDGGKHIHELLLRYSKECRNDHFHKDNIDCFSEVECIRNNTYLIIYFLLGGCEMSGNLEYNKMMLGAIDDTFDRIYKKVIEIPRSVRKFYIQFENRKKIAVRRLIEQDGVQYDEYGSVSDSVIKFVLEEKYTDTEEEPDMKEDIVISKNNIPEKMWFINHRGECVAIEW
jgi:hypothetical protein